MKIDPPLIILALTILAAGAAYWSTIENNDQLNRMEKYDTLNIKLSKEIQELSDLNNSIAKRIDTIVTENFTLTEQNFRLTQKANELIEKVEQLTNTSNELIKKVDVRTEKTSAENAVTGIIDFVNEIPFNKNEKLVFSIGGNKMAFMVERFTKLPLPGLVKIGDKDIIPIKVEDGRIKISIVVLDLDGKVLIEIKDNVWVKNSNNGSKFNYDSNGLEVIDNQGFVALSINMDSRTEVSIQGYFLERITGSLFIYGGKGIYPTNINSSKKNIIEIIEKADIRRLFEYPANNWIGKRKKI